MDAIGIAAVERSSICSAQPKLVGLISRLTYSDLQAHSGEVFGRAEHLSGFFIKGFVGGGAITGGGLRDEDFVTRLISPIFQHQ